MRRLTLAALVLLLGAYLLTGVVQVRPGIALASVFAHSLGAGIR